MRRCQADTARDPGARATARDCAVRELLGIEVECNICKLWWVLSTPIKSFEVEGVLHNSPTLRAPSGSAAEPASESELPLISQELPQELPLIPWLHSAVTLSGSMVTLNFTRWLHASTGTSAGDSTGASADSTGPHAGAAADFTGASAGDSTASSAGGLEGVAATSAATLARAAAGSGEAHVLIAHVRHCRTLYEQ